MIEMRVRERTSEHGAGVAASAASLCNRCVQHASPVNLSERGKKKSKK